MHAGGSLSPDAQYRNQEWSDSAEYENPAKFLMHRPSASELLAVLATTCEALRPVQAVLMYVSAAGEQQAADLDVTGHPVALSKTRQAAAFTRTHAP